MTWKDLASASRHKAVRSRVWLLLAPLLLGLVLLTVVVQGVVFRLAGLVLLVYIGSCPLWGPTAATWLQARRRTWPDAPTRWLPTDSGLAIDGAGRQSTLPWPGLTKVSSWRRGVSLTYGRAVAFIPSRAFSSREHRQAFVDAVHASKDHDAAV